MRRADRLAASAARRSSFLAAALLMAALAVAFWSAWESDLPADDGDVLVPVQMVGN
jgi:hypothetical protein